MKIIKLQAEWCGPCKNLSKWMESFTFAHEIETKDIDDNPDAASEYGIRGIPAIILVDDDSKKVDDAVGFGPAQTFLRTLIVQ